MAVGTVALLGWIAAAAAAADPARKPSCNWSTVPLFAHFRAANFSSSDLQLMSTLRIVTMQGTLYGGMSAEQQAQHMRESLPIPVLIYRNLYYAEPWDASIAAMRAHPAWQLKGPDGKPLNPEGKLVYNMSNPDVPTFYASAIANISSLGWVDGALADSGCHVTPGWLPPAQQAAFAAGQGRAAAASQQALDARGGLFVQNCPYLPREPGGGKGDPWFPGVDGVMYESWCSDFQTGVGGPGSAEFCRYEVLFVLSGPAAWNNGSVIQARYYLNGHNKADPRFGAIAFMVAGYEGAYFGASTNWWWAGDWEKQSASPWAKQLLGTPGPPQMLDKGGCGWARTFASGARVFANFCFRAGHPMSAHAVWSDNSTWPPSLGASAADATVEAHRADRALFEGDDSSGAHVGVNSGGGRGPSASIEGIGGWAALPRWLAVTEPVRTTESGGGGGQGASCRAVNGRSVGTLIVMPEGGLACLGRR